MIEKRALLAVLICPNCEAPLGAFDKCMQCGAEYDKEDEIPAIFPNKKSKSVTFQFAQCRSLRTADFERCFSFPPTSKASGTKPYHLDDAHLVIIETLPPHSTILEIGCGGAQMRNYVEALGHRYIGVDISKHRVDEELQRHGGPDFLCDAHFLPLADRCVDVIYSSAVTEHLACPYLVVQQAARCLKHGGYYLGNVSFLEPWHDDSFFHMTPLGVFELLTQANFEICHIWPSRSYSAFNAVMAMGNKATKSIRFLGDALNFVYMTTNRFRNVFKGQASWTIDNINDVARISGATDWIARRP